MQYLIGYTANAIVFKFSRSFLWQMESNAFLMSRKMRAEKRFFQYFNSIPLISLKLDEKYSVYVGNQTVRV